jgi:hypothetical protein
MSEIIKSISNVMAQVGSVKKEGTNQFHNYKYAAAADVLHKLQPLLAKEGLVIFQNERERSFIEGGAILSVTYEFTLAHKSGELWPEKIVRTGMAPARNSKGGFDDKALNKCHTAAHKYFHITLFEIPTGDYDDADADEDKPAATTRQAAPRQIKAAPPIEPPVNPETGEVGPHTITAADEMAWGGLFVAAVNVAKSEDEIDEWLASNAAGLSTLESAAPKIYERVMKRVEEKKRSFNKKEAA